MKRICTVCKQPYNTHESEAWNNYAYCTATCETTEKSRTKGYAYHPVTVNTYEPNRNPKTIP